MWYGHHSFRLRTGYRLGMGIRQAWPEQHHIHIGCASWGSHHHRAQGSRMEHSPVDRTVDITLKAQALHLSNVYAENAEDLLTTDAPDSAIEILEGVSYEWWAIAQSL
jgi:hypothetical protein